MHRSEGSAVVFKSNHLNVRCLSGKSKVLPQQASYDFVVFYGNALAAV